MLTPDQCKEARRTKVCRVCGQTKVLDDFYASKTARDRKQGLCKRCQCARTTSKGRDRSAYRKSPRGAAQDLVATARRRAKEAGVPFTITIDWLADKIALGFCEATGIPFEVNFDPGRHNFAPSLDQTIPRLGYTPENTKVVCWGYNAAKGTGTHDDVIKLAHGLLTHTRGL